MTALPADLYARWLREHGGSPFVFDGHGAPPERWLQQVWRHQRLRRGELRGLDGRTVRVLHPGFWNRGPGPDFQRAVIQFGEEPPIAGDVEIDVGIGGWRGHGHDRNARYAQVVLHVVWDSPARDLHPPVLPLAPFLEAPLAELAPWLDGDALPELPASSLGQCCAPLASLPAGQLAELLHQAAQVRLERKAGEFARRARQAGWEAALWEGLFTALGYRHNTWPMRCLAELLGAAHRLAPDDSVNWEARLLGLAGLLPAQLPAGYGAAHVRQLWEIWWRERDGWSASILPATLWQLGGLRPANHPQRRLALAARWLAGDPLAEGLVRWLETPAPERFVESLADRLTPTAAATGFWSHHWTLRSPPLPKPQGLLGLPRLTDLALNVVLPWLHARAAAGGNVTLLAEIARRHFAWPAGEDNSVLKLTRARLFGAPRPRLPRTAAVQQGLLQITRDFCDRTDALCTGCRFPELIRALPDGTPSGTVKPAVSGWRQDARM